MAIPRSLPTDRPTDAADYRILSGGQALAGSFQVVAIIVSHEANRISTAEIILNDGNPAQGSFQASEASELATDSDISIELGYHQSFERVFEGKVVGKRIEFNTNRSLLRITCKDASYKLSIGRNSRYFYNQKDSDIINAVLRDRGMRGTVEATSYTYEEMVQYYSTDWDFILSRAETTGMLVFTENGSLSVKKPSFSQAPALQLMHGATLLAFEAEMDGRYQYSAVKATSWDSAKQETISYTGQDPRATSPGNSSSAHLASSVGIGELNVAHAGEAKAEELQAWAGATRLRSQLAKIRGRARIQGVSSIMPGQIIELDGLGAEFSGSAYVTGVRQELNANNWETDITFGLSPECYSRQFDDIQALPAEGLLPPMKGLHIAVVTKLEEDPQGQHRVRVRIPSLDTEGNGMWARVASLDAGENRGFFFRPEIGDEVVLGFLHDDPRNPIILGQLHSSQKAAPFTAQDTNHEKGYVSREQIKLTFNDEKKSVVLETPGGRILTMDDDAGEISLKDPDGSSLIIDSEGITLDSAKNLVLKAAQDITIEGTNVDIAANAQAKLEGAAGTEVSSSANMVIKGAIVQIN